MSLLLYTPFDDNYEAWLQAFAQHAPALNVVCGTAAASDQIEYALVWKPPHGFLKTLPSLQAIFSMGAGIDHLTADPELPALPLIRQRDAGMGLQMAEYSLYAALHYQRDFDLMRDNQQSKHWYQELSRVRRRLTVGVLGMGTLGTVVAQSLVANGFPVCGWSRSPKQLSDVDSYTGESGLQQFLSRSDMLVCLLPDTVDTRSIVDAKLLAQLPRGAAVVNLARGPLVVDEDLLAALHTGQLRGAMLDVFHSEPLPTDHAFWSHPKIIVTPHVAAETVFSQSAQQVAAEISLIQQGLPATEVVDLNRGY